VSTNRLRFADEAELAAFAATLGRFERGEITPEAWHAYRLVHGVYPQSQDERSMVRVKIPQGVLDAEQLRALAEVAVYWSRGFGHVTTRQNVQFHFVRPRDVPQVLAHLGRAGLTTREACGNSVRNITACPYAGVAADEVFDVTPYARALTHYLLRHRLSASLPRKFKIAFEGCASRDHAATGIHDIGFRARLRGDGAEPTRGFQVVLAGGTSTWCNAATELFEFLPAVELLNVAEAVVRVFHTLGDREHRQRARMKFLLQKLGAEAFRATVLGSLAAVRSEGGTPLPFDPEQPPFETEPRAGRTAAPTTAEAGARAAAAVVRGPGIRPRLLPAGGGFGRWQASNVRAQRQPGFACVTVTLPLGDVTAGQLRLLADFATAYGDGTVRTTIRQNLVLRWVATSAVRELYERLAAAGLGQADADTAADVVSCPGAESCRLAVTHSRGLAELLTASLRARPDLVDAASDLLVNISGCPNGCGQHHVAGIGFQGSLRKIGDRALPQYFVMVGGGVDAGVRFGRLAAKVPARRVPAALERLIELYAARKEPGETASAFFARLPTAEVKALLADLESVRPEEATADDFVDPGEEASTGD
jgi:sulfite reductase (NADPH) hemoprotein beta-component